MKKRTILLITFFTIIIFMLLLTGLSQAITLSVSPNPANVNQNITANISVNTLTACNAEINFGDSPTWISLFPPCTSLTGIFITCPYTASHIYTNPGMYTVAARTQTGSSCGPTPATRTVTIRCLTLTMRTSSPLPGATVGQTYSSQLLTAGGQTPVTFSIVSGSLSPGLSLSPAGVISGSPTTAGTYSFTVRATDSCSLGAQTVQTAFSLTVRPAPCIPPNITTPSPLSSGTVGQPYSSQLQTSGGQGAITYTLSSGSLPPGLNLSTSGLISGTPTTAGNYSFMVSAQDQCISASGDLSVSSITQKAFSIQINSPLLSFSAIPSSSALPRGQSSSVTVGYRFTGIPSFGGTLNSSSGSFAAGGDTIDRSPVPLIVNIQNGSGSVSEVVHIPVRVIERTLERNTNRFLYIRTFTGPDGTTLTVTTDFFITTEATAGFDVKRIELYFENRRAEITVDRNYPDLKAFADIRFVGSGLLQGFWEVDGRVLSTVNQHLTFAGRVTLQVPDLPPFPTFDPGSHVVRFVITSPVTELPLPSIIYFVTTAEFKGKQFSIKLISPEDEAPLEYSTVKFDWEKLSTTTLFLIQYFDDPVSKPIFSAFTRQPSYLLPEIVLRKIFSPGQNYYWKVEGFDSENNNIGESGTWSFSFK